MRGFSPLLLTLWCVAGFACSRPDEPIPDDGLGRSFQVARIVKDHRPKLADPVVVLQAEPFLFHWRPFALTSSEMDVQVDGQGQVTCTVVLPQLETSSGTQPASVVLLERRATFTLAADTTQELRTLLATGGFLDLEREYHANVADGLVVEAELTAGDYRKSVFCNNHFPPELRMISRFIRERILAPHQQDLDAAKTVTVRSGSVPSK